jgi:hypothetical protein
LLISYTIIREKPWLHGKEKTMNKQFAGSNETSGSAVTRHLRVRRALLVCGILSSLIWLGIDIIAALRYEGYSYPFDPISGLTAIDAPTRSFVNTLSPIYIVLKAAFSLGVWKSAGQKRALRITAGLLFAWALTDLTAFFFFPWRPAEALGTFLNIMHALLAGGIAVLLMLLIIGFGATANGKWFRLYSYGTLLLMIILGTLPLVNGFQITMDQIPEGFGVGERINAYGYMLWMMVLAIVLLRSQHNNSSIQDSQ